MLGNKLVVGIRLLTTLTEHQQGGDGKAGLTHGSGSKLSHSAQPRYVVIDHRFGKGGKIEDVFTGGSVDDVMTKMKKVKRRKDVQNSATISKDDKQWKSKDKPLHGQGDSHTHTHTHTHKHEHEHEQGKFPKQKGILSSQSSTFSLIRPDPSMSKSGKGASSHSSSSTTPSPSTGEAMHQCIEALQTPGRPLPYPWWLQCYNDRVHDCSHDLVIFEQDMRKHPVSVLIQHYRAKHSAFDAPNSRTLAVMMRLLGELPVNEGAIPIFHYMALEMLLGMGFTPVRGLTSLAKHVIDVSPFLPPGNGGQLGPHVVYVARLGLHRLLAALLDVGDIRFAQDSAQFRDLLTEARYQPYSLVQILKRITSPLLKRVIALDCPQCGQLARAIHHLLAIKLPAPLEPLCLANGSHPVVPLQSGLEVLSRGLNRPEQVALARAVLDLVFDLPLSYTNCPRCADLVGTPRANARMLVNAMLECYCTPQSKFHLIS